MNNLQIKFGRASKLLDEVSGERERWGERVRALSGLYRNLVGDIALAAATVTYLGSATPTYRSQMLALWKEQVEGHDVHHSPDFQLGTALTSETTIREWSFSGLPTDPESLTSATVLFEAIRVPLIMDPQGYAVTWFKKLGFATATHMEDEEFERKLQQCLGTGTGLVINGIDGFDTHPIIVSLLKREVVVIAITKGGKSKTAPKTTVSKPHILIGRDKKPMLFNEKFQLYFTSTEDNPSYAAVFHAKVNIVNFTLTFEALEAKLVDTLVEKDAPNVENQRKQLQQEDLELHKELEVVEDKILFQLASAKGDVLEDDDLLEMLSELTTESKTLSIAMKAVQDAALKIRESRNMYLPVAHRSSLVFFSLGKLISVNPMYSFGLRLFTSQFTAHSFADTKLPLEERLQIMIQKITLAVFKTVCRSLLRSDSLMFAFILSHTLDDIASQPAWPIFTESSSKELAIDTRKSPPSWISPKYWELISRLAQLPGLEGLDADIVEHEQQWKDVAHTDGTALHHCAELPGDWNGKMSPIQKFCIGSFLNTDCIRENAYAFVASTLGEIFVEFPTGFELLRSFEDSSPSTALILVTEEHCDPTTEILEFATDRGMGFAGCQVFPCPAGTGQQSARLEKAIRDCMYMGGWIILQNCHLGLGWLPWLARLLDTTAKHSMQANFRVWLVSLPTDGFPVSLLSNGIKVVYEHPTDFQTSMALCYTAHKHMFTEDVQPASKEWQVLYKTCVMHAAVEERGRFGHLGWSNQHVSFSRADLRVALLHWKEFGVGAYHAYVCMDPGTTSRSRDTAKESGKCGSVLLENFVNVLARFVYGGMIEDSADLARLRSTLVQCFGFGQALDPLSLPPPDPKLKAGLRAVTWDVIPVCPPPRSAAAPLPPVAKAPNPESPPPPIAGAQGVEGPAAELHPGGRAAVQPLPTAGGGIVVHAQHRVRGRLSFSAGSATGRALRRALWHPALRRRDRHHAGRGKAAGES